ncbi:hypothetical protein BGX31_001447 [Mortierella sp. GBA43]|nr:hypothetical protein BGX31_001447 [Mortierella sp. GBA43]
MSSLLLRLNARPWARSLMVSAGRIATTPLQQLRPVPVGRHSSISTWTSWGLSTLRPDGGFHASSQPRIWLLQAQQRGFASTTGSDDDEEEFIDENGMTIRDREKIEKWAEKFTKDSIPKGLLTLNFVRSSGPGGQNVNKGKFYGYEQSVVSLSARYTSVNTKVDMRFVVDEAMWLPEYVRDRLKSEESNRINKSGEYVLASDSKRTQMANLDDCMEKLHDILLKMAKLPSLPDAESLAKLDRMSGIQWSLGNDGLQDPTLRFRLEQMQKATLPRYLRRKAADNRRKANKQFQSKKKASRRISRDD